MKSFPLSVALFFLPLLSLFAQEAATVVEPFRLETNAENGPKFREMQYRTEIWYDSPFWQAETSWCRVGKNWQHSGETGDSVRTFLVPTDGEVKITGIVKKWHLDGDGIVASILHNEKEVWRKELDGKDSIGTDPNLFLDVRKGDRIRFAVNRRGDIVCDTTAWDPVIAYPASGERFVASEGFSEKQAAGNWCYETTSPSEATPRPTVVATMSEADYRGIAEGLPNVPDFEMMPLVLSEWVQDDHDLDDLPGTIREHLDRIVRLLESRDHAVNELEIARELLKEFETPARSAAKEKTLYLRTRLLKRSILFGDSRTRFGELLFVKSRPTAYSHLVGQYFGWNQRPGGGLYVLERPGYSLKHRDLLRGALPPGHVLEPRLSYAADRVAFSHVVVPESRIPWETLPVNEQGGLDHYYHLYEMSLDGSGLRRLTNDRYDDMMPEYLPDGGLAFVSTRRKAYSRCFGPQFGKRWHSYTLFRTDADEQGRPDADRLTQLSFNDVSEWFPAMSPSGTLLFARWDYIDRDAVTHQNLWAIRPDGTNPVAVWGNAVSKPHCTFQAKPIPDSNKIVFIASAHHSITAGPVCVLDPTVGANSLDAIRRITPGPFPEAESWDISEYYNSPWPLGENLFLAAYSRDRLIFEPTPNKDDALGLYLIDDQGNREVIFRDPEIGSTCPLPIVARPVPLPISSSHDIALAAEGLGEMSIADVSEGLGPVPPGSLKQLRIVQIFPKTTVVANEPRIGVAGEENTRAVLGIVPIEEDGSARFLVPAGKPILFQVLDENGFAYQTMRSTTSVMPGEQVSCIGCHEERSATAGRPKSLPIAFSKPPSRLIPTPESDRPFGFVETIQPILDAKCLCCHNSEKTEGGYDLSRRLDENGFTASYRALCDSPELVPRFAERNQIQQTAPGGAIGARGSRLIRLLQEGHEGVELTSEEFRLLGTWLDLNAVFYGAYDPALISHQQKGEPIPMPERQ